MPLNLGSECHVTMFRETTGEEEGRCRKVGDRRLVKRKDVVKTVLQSGLCGSRLRKAY